MKTLRLAPLTLLAACTTVVEVPPRPLGPCRVDEATRMRFVAREWKPAMRPALEAEANSAIVRVLRPGDAATMDFREDRLNVGLDDTGRIDDLRCG